MSSYSKTIIIGNLGADPDVRQLPSGDSVANLSVATSEKWKDKDGNPQERTEWHRVSVFGKLADLCGQYLTKGRQVLVEGQNQTRKWDDKEGVTRYSTEIKAFKVVFLGGDGKRDGGAERPPHPAERREAPASSGGGEPVGNGGNDDFPFSPMT